MKHARTDYDRIQDPSGKIPDDEPVFLLRAQDKTAPKIVRAWADANRTNADVHLVAAAYRQALAMEVWQEERGAKWADGEKAA